MSSFTTSINLPQGSSFSPPAWQPHLQRLCSLLVAFVHINLISSPRPLTPSVPAIPLISNLRVISSAFSSLWQSLSWRLNPDWTVHNSYERHLFFIVLLSTRLFTLFSVRFLRPGQKLWHDSFLHCPQKWTESPQRYLSTCSFISFTHTFCHFLIKESRVYLSHDQLYAYN